MEDPELLYKIALTQIPMVGAVLAKSLVSFAGGAEAIFHQKKSVLLKVPGVGDKIADNILQKRTFATAEEELKFIHKNNIKALFYLHKDYPVRLKRIRDAPVMLYCKGQCNLNTKRILAIVGTRKPSLYGINQCKNLVSQLRQLDVLVLSGLAYGIDVTAHRMATEVGLQTVGVLGCGLDRMYPAAHKRVANEMVASGGGLLSEFVHGTKPDKENFPMRNRIIAGMCDALVVVESDIRGGSMITAEMANGYHKDVFALPGRIGDQFSRGCNHLIKTNRAHLLESSNELCDHLQWHHTTTDPSIQPKLFETLSEQEQKIYDLLTENEQTSIDRIYKEVQLTVSQVASVLLNLEFKGLIRALPGKMYMIA